MDTFHVPPQFGGWPEGSAIQYYFGSSSAANEFKVWYKPRGKTFLSVWMIGGGGGGGGGAGNTAGSGKGGGGGGGGAAPAACTFLLARIPDTLYVRAAEPGLGGAGGSSGNGTAGSGGGASRLAVYPNTTVQNLILTTSGGSGGGAGTTVPGGGAGGGGGGSGQDGGNPLVFIARIGGSWYMNGIAGTNGGANAAGTDWTWAATSMALGGCGGGGSTAGTVAGGGYPALANTLHLAVPGGAAGANPGGPGFWHKQGMVYYGGTGAGGNNTTGGAAGGSAIASPGAGGGGGGGGVTTGGRGGDGGPGLVIMACW